VHLLRKWVLSFDGVILSAILKVLTRYSANERRIPVNDGGEASLAFWNAGWVHPLIHIVTQSCSAQPLGIH
jgi:hypothetical protein